MLPQTRDAKSRDDWLVSLSWGLYLVGVGSIWLLGNISRFNLDEFIWLWGGLLLLALNGVRYLLKLKMSKFTLGLGALLLIRAIGNLFGVQIPFFPVLLIVIGAAMLLDTLIGSRHFKRKDDDYAVDESTSLTTQP